MKAVMMSIKPEWCEKIASGEKIIEVRKNRPILETPFKVYVYCTKPKHRFSVGCGNYYFDDQLFKESGKIIYGCDFGGIFEPTVYYNGKVIGEFVCDEIIECQMSDDYSIYDVSDDEIVDSCLSLDELWEYGKGKTLYGWHIADLVIYDKPKKFYDFVSFCPEYEKQNFTTKCHDCEWFVENRDALCYECACEGEKRVRRPPQSWCYVEEMRADYEEFKKEKIKS